jgi:hypothetical protein
MFTMGPNVGLRRFLGARQQKEPPRGLSLSAGLRSAHEITFAHNTDKMAVVVDDWNSADSILNQLFGDLLDARVWIGSDDALGHDILCLHLILREISAASYIVQ